MKLDTNLKVFGDVDKISKAFEAEEFSKGRSEIKMKKGKKDLTFNIKSKDLTSMRAAFNSILKLLMVYDKMENIK